MHPNSSKYPTDGRKMSLTAFALFLPVPEAEQLSRTLPCNSCRVFVNTERLTRVFFFRWVQQSFRVNKNSTAPEYVGVLQGRVLDSCSASGTETKRTRSNSSFFHQLGTLMSLDTFKKLYFGSDSTSFPLVLLINPILLEEREQEVGS
jgi:hypothetical protein